MLGIGILLMSMAIKVNKYLDYLFSRINFTVTLFKNTNWSTRASYYEAHSVMEVKKRWLEVVKEAMKKCEQQAY